MTVGYWSVVFLDFCGVTGVGGWFGMGDWVLTQGSLLCRDDNFGVGWFGMGDLFLTQGALLCWDDKVWVGGCFGMGDWVLTQGSLLRRDDKVWVGGGLTNLTTTLSFRGTRNLCVRE